MSAGDPLDQPFEALQKAPRTVWMPALVCSAGELEARLNLLPSWLSAWVAGVLPPLEEDGGAPEAWAAFRRVAGELGLPQLTHGRPQMAEQVLRSIFWHWDRLVDRVGLSGAAAIRAEADAFRDAWAVQMTDFERIAVILPGLGDLGAAAWDALRGRLRQREWTQARTAQEALERLPELQRLIERLGRARSGGDAAPAVDEEPLMRSPVRLRAVSMPSSSVPGEVMGLMMSAQLDRMIGAEAVLVRHPVWRKLFRARHAEARLLSYQMRGEVSAWRPDPDGAQETMSVAPPRPQEERGPFILCMDTSGSMRGGPEVIAKAVVLHAVRTAVAERRPCLLLSFGASGELVETVISLEADGIHRLFDFLGQSFDGGTDVQSPVERAIALVRDGGWRHADVLIVSDGEFGCVPSTLDMLDAARAELALRVQGVLVGDRETMGMMEVCDDIHWLRHWRDFAEGGQVAREFSPVHSRSLTALFFPNALSPRAARHRAR